MPKKKQIEEPVKRQTPKPAKKQTKTPVKKQTKKPTKHKTSNGHIHPTRIFREAEEMLNAWNEFKQNLKEQSKEWLKVQYVGKDGVKKEDGQKIPLTLEGFKRFCREHEKYGEIEQYFSNQGGIYHEFVGICSRIREEIRENQIIGGLLGFFNPSITQRLNSLEDRQVISDERKTVGDLFPEIDTDE